MIKINPNLREEEYPAELFTPKGESLGFIYSNKQLLDVRTQIKEQQEEGYYLKWKDIVLFIDKDGYILNRPNDFFDITEAYAKYIMTK